MNSDTQSNVSIYSIHFSLLTNGADKFSEGDSECRCEVYERTSVFFVSLTSVKEGVTHLDKQRYTWQI